MRRLARALLVVAGLTAGLAAGVGAALFAIALGSLPAHEGTRRITGLDAPVTIHRDAHAVPYIEAASERDGYFALGFVHAQDRLWQMELRRRVAAGRLAELTGAGALSLDRFMRLLRLHELAAASLAHMAPENRALVAAYTAGVNAFLEQRRRLLPPEFWALWHRPEPWTDADSVVVVKLMALDLARNWRRELLRARLARDLPAATYRQLFPAGVDPDAATLAALDGLDLDGLAAIAGPPPPSSHGSNAWVVDGRRSATGAPLLANDPHLGFEMPGVWYLAGLKTPELEVVGATLAGLPIFVAGRTDRIAWGLTNTGSDVQDLVIERLVGTPARATVTPEGEAPLDVAANTIRCRFCPDEDFAARWSVNGPLISDLVARADAMAGPGSAMALRWTALDPEDTTVEAGFAVPRAGDWPSFLAALEPFANPQQNILYADVDGRIGIVSPGRVPIRAVGDGTLPVRGWERASAWTGFIPFAALPRRVDPADGVIANANNPLVDGSYPFLLARRWDHPYRFERIQALLAAAGHDIARFRALQNDVRSGVGADLLPLLLDASPEAAGAAAPWLARLAAWDRHATPESREKLVFAAWYDAVPARLYADELGPAFEVYGRQRPWFIRRALTAERDWCDDVTTPPRETCATILGHALADAVRALEAALGPEGPAWDWGRQHPARFTHPFWDQLGPLARLANLELAIGGDDTTVAAASPARRASPPLFASSHGVSYRHIVDLAAPERSRFVAATGQVGHVLSRHYGDLAALWRDGRDIEMRRPERPVPQLVLHPG